MTETQKFEIALLLDNEGIGVNEVEEMLFAVKMDDQEKINSQLAWTSATLELHGVTPKNIESIYNFLIKF